MKYKNIFWLDDNPYFFPFIENVQNKKEPGLDITDIFSRTTFAQDFKTGTEIVRSHDFDLYILNADFPEEMPSSSREEWKKYFLEVQAKTRKLDRTPKFSGHKVGNFVPFYKQNLEGKNNVVVFSSSMSAIVPATELKLPYYYKLLDMNRRDISEFAVNFGSDDLEIRNWEHGCLEDFIQKYLV